jgi:hypothetical protein
MLKVGAPNEEPEKEDKQLTLLSLAPTRNNQARRNIWAGLKRGGGVRRVVFFTVD